LSATADITSSRMFVAVGMLFAGATSTGSIELPDVRDGGGAVSLGKAYDGTITIQWYNNHMVVQ